MIGVKPMRSNSQQQCAGAAAAESRLNLLVRYLDHAVDDDQLRRFFAPFGNIASSMVMRDILTGESRGFGFVRFFLSSDAAAALAQADGKKIGGKAVNVLWAKQQHDVTPAGQDRLRMNKLFLRNVPMEVTEQDLAALVRRCGEVTEVSLHNDKISAACHAPCRRIAFIVFRTEGAAEAALQAVHNTCPFRSCYDIPLMAKLSEDYKARPATATPPASTFASTSLTSPAALLPPSRRLSPEVISVPCILKFTDQSSFTSSTPTSVAARSPGISSLVPSLDSTSLEVANGAAPMVRQVSAMELESGAQTPYGSLRTPLTRRSSDVLYYRHNPYACTQILPTTVTSAAVPILGEPPVAAFRARRG